MVHEQEPLQPADLPRLAEAWLQDVGALTAVALAIWGLAYFIDRSAKQHTQPDWLTKAFAAGLSLTGLGYVAAAIAWLIADATRTVRSSPS